MKYRGQVTQAPFGKGSKSERQAVYLTIPGLGKYVLRRLGGNAFQDSELEALVGHEIECDGAIDGYTLTITRYRLRN